MRILTTREIKLCKAMQQIRDSLIKINQTVTKKMFQFTNPKDETQPITDKTKLHYEEL